MEVQTPTSIAFGRVDALSNSVGLPAASGLDCDLDCHAIIYHVISPLHRTALHLQVGI